MVKPISPAEAKEAKQFVIPEYVISAVNELLVKKLHPTSKSQNITLKQGDVVQAVIEKAAEGGIIVTSSELFAEHHLDFEAAFKAVGWTVDYDRPGYCESYEAFWNFKSS